MANLVFLTKRANFVTVSMGTVLVSLLLLAGGCTEQQQQQSTDAVVIADAPADPVARGRASFDAYCMNCHGPEGKGNGPVAPLLKIALPDLTTLSARNNGTFPVSAVIRTIDGREWVEGHGAREMPVWGNIWTDDISGVEGEQLVTEQINELAEYLRSIQQ